jgi:hypothetical protein
LFVPIAENLQWHEASSESGLLRRIRRVSSGDSLQASTRNLFRPNQKKSKSGSTCGGRSLANMEIDWVEQLCLWQQLKIKRERNGDESTFCIQIGMLENTGVADRDGHAW